MYGRRHTIRQAGYSSSRWSGACPAPCESRPAGSPERLAHQMGSCRAHRAKEPAHRGLTEVGGDPDGDIARHDFHQRGWRTRRITLTLLVQEGLAPTEQLRRRNPQAAGQRGNIDARFQSGGNRLCLELIPSPATLADRRTVPPLDELQATSRGHRRRTRRRHGTPEIGSMPEPYPRPATPLTHGVSFPLTNRVWD